MARVFKIGDRVICNGHYGSVRVILAERKMVIVQLARGQAQVDTDDEQSLCHATPQDCFDSLSNEGREYVAKNGAYEYFQGCDRPMLDAIALIAREWLAARSAPVTVETITRKQIEDLRASLPRDHYAIQWTIDALVPSASHPNRQRNAHTACVEILNARLKDAKP
jgi:hypothetical protein